MKIFYTVILVQVLLVVSFFMVAGCSKNQEPGKPRGSSSGVLVKKFVLLDTTRTAPNDTLRVIYFTYDNSDRLTKVSTIYYNWTGAPDTTSFNQPYWSTRSFYYNGTDTMPFKTINARRSNVGFAWIIKDTSYRKYDAASRLISDSSYTYGYISGNINPGSFGSNFMSYTYGAQYVVRKLYTITHNGAPLEVDSVLQSAANGNVYYQKDPRPVSPNFGYTLHPTCNFIFDNHPNPMNKNGAFTEPIYNSYNDFGIGVNFENQKNNYTSVKKSVPIPSGSNDIEFTYKYTYLSDGYPASVSITNHFQGGAFITFKGVYIY